MSQVFLQVAIPVLYVYDEDVLPERPPAFDMSFLPVVSRLLKDHAGTEKVTVISGTPVASAELEGAWTRLALQYHTLQRASPSTASLLVAEFVADNFDAEEVVQHLQRIVAERQKDLADQVAQLGRRPAGASASPTPEDASHDDEASTPEDSEDEDDGDDSHVKP